MRKAKYSKRPKSIQRMRRPLLKRGKKAQDPEGPANLKFRPTLLMLHPMRPMAVSNPIPLSRSRMIPRVERQMTTQNMIKAVIEVAWGTF